MNASQTNEENDLQREPVHPDTRCIRCTYMLRGMTVGQRCPECGTPVSHSYMPDRVAGQAIASLALGVLGIPMLSSGVPAVVGGILAIVFARQADRLVHAGQAAPWSLTLARTGRLCGWVAVVLGTIATLLFIARVRF